MVQPQKTVSLFHYLGAWLYDSLLVLAILLFASLIYLLPDIIQTPAESAQAANLNPHRFQSAAYQSWILLCWFVFFAWFWTQSGQTLGLRAWKLKLIDQNGVLMSLRQALVRFFIALLPWVITLFVIKQISFYPAFSLYPYRYVLLVLGFSGLLWRFIDRDRCFLADRIARTRVVYDTD